MYVCSIPKESCFSDTTEILLELQRHQTAERFKEVVREIQVTYNPREHEVNVRKLIVSCSGSTSLNLSRYRP